MRLLFIAICLYMLWGYSSLAHAAKYFVAQTAQGKTRVAQNRTSTQRLAQASPSRFSLKFDIETSSNLRATTDPDYAGTASFNLAPSYQFTKHFALKTRAGAERELGGLQESSLLNTEISLSYAAVELSDRTALSLSAAGVLPTNEKDRVEKTFRGATGGSADITQSYTILRQPGSLTYSLGGLKNYHEYDRSSEDVQNLSYRFRHTLALSQDLSKLFSVELLARYQTGWTYLNSLRTSFLLSEQINLNVNPLVSLHISHINDGDALTANGVDSNIKAYDKSTSQFGVGLTAKF